MSDSNEHEPLIKTPKQLICAIAAAFVIPIAVIVLLANYVTTGEKPAAGSDAMTKESIAELKPIAQFEFTDTNAPRVLKTGMDVYNASCAACHASGAAGAPKFSDKDQWAPRLSKGFDTLWKHALQGFNAMPAKGGNADLDDVEVARAVAYMANQAGADFKAPEPAAPVEAASTTKPEAETPAK